MTNHTATPTPSVVRVTGPQGLVSAVPVYLGFQPANSLVVLCLTAPRGRVAPVMRIDLFPPDAVEAVEQLIDGARRYADAVAVVCYRDAADRPGCLDTLLAELHAAEIPVTMVLSVHEGLIRDASSAIAEASDPGVPAPTADDEPVRTLTAASALAGRRVLPTREALRASIAGPVGTRRVEARAAIARQYDLLAGEYAARSVDAVTIELPSRADAALDRARAEYVDSGKVTMATAAEIIVLASDIATRDRLVARSVAPDEPDIVPALIAIATWCPDEDAAEICSVLAVAAYRFGDGALAHCAVDRVLAVAPEHRLGHLMLAAMVGGLPPGELAGMADIAPDSNGPDRGDH